MKKILALLLAFVLVLGMAACAAAPADDNGNKETNGAAEELKVGFIFQIGRASCRERV